MKRIAFLILCLIFLCTQGMAQSYNFAEMKWGSPVAEVKSNLTSKDFKVTIDNDGDLKFEGQLIAKPSVGFALFSKGQLSKVIVTIVTSDREARRTYADMKDVLTKKYGKPANDYAFFQRPYYEGDGFEEQAIRLGKGHFSCFWGTSTDGGEKLGLQLTERLTVTVTYESSFWAEEADRRKAKGTKIF